ncbi:hypothetical protein Hanom_Chr06g00538821 [Helianthus anomalus]
MHEIAKTNGKRLPGNVRIVIDKEMKSGGHKEDIETRTKENVTDRRNQVKNNSKMFVSSDGRESTAVVYYGLNLNATNLKTNLYLNSIAEMPAYLLTAILIGRKPLGVGTKRFSEIFCILGGFMGSQENWKVMRMADETLVNTEVN